MGLLLSLHDLSKSFGSQKLFESISFTLSDGDRMGLGGPNGTGKSTLLKILCEIESPDSGHVAKKQGIKISYAGQFPEFQELPLIDLLSLEVPWLSKEEAQLEAIRLLDKAGFKDFEARASRLSGGWKKRLDIVRSWMKGPDLVLLDEPTNHLDLEGIAWLEQFLKREKTAFLVVSHDRSFLESVCNKVAEMNRCFPKGIFISDGNWSSFLERKEAFLEGQKEQQRSLAGQVREEIDWLRRSPKARTTKSKSRVQKAHELIEELQEVKSRNSLKKAGIDFNASERETRNLLVATNLAKSIDDKMLFQGVNIKLSPGSRLGIVGKNGSGKTTLLKVLAGMIPQDKGTVKYAPDLNLVYFDQHRQTLDLDLSLKEALSPRGEFVHYQGKDIHVNGWARKFLFSPERLSLPLRALSGGERARILIARLMLEPADILFLDEPTNDLDIPTLEVIEESLLEFTGAVILITHDRYLMDRICTSIVGLGEEKESSVFADYAQWQQAIQKAEEPKVPLAKQPSLVPASSKPKKLSYKEQKELDGMEEAILAKETILADLHQKIEGTSGLNASQLYQKMGEVQKELEALYERWQELLTRLKD
jgi:ATP-binding cassette subfamily F protein uup